MKSLAVADVEVVKMVSTYPYAQVVKSVSVSEDGMTATIEVFNSFVDGSTYVIKVKGFDDATMVASVGDPVRMEVVASGKYPSNIITTNEAATIACVFYDDQNVDVTSTVNTQRITFQLEKAATNGDFYLAGNKLTIKKDSSSAVVIAKYLGKFENGKYVGALEAKTEFFAIDASAVVPLSVKAYDLDGNWYDGVDTRSLEIGEAKTLLIKLNHNINNSTNEWGDKAYTNNTGYNANAAKEKITITAINPDVADISYAGLVKAHKAGVAQFYVNYATKQADGTWAENPFAIIEIEVLDNAIVNAVQFANSSALVGTVTGNGYNKAYLEFIAYDQRGNRINIGSDASFKFKCLSDGYGDEAVMTSLASYPNVNKWMDTYYGDGKEMDCIKVEVDGDALRDILAGSANSPIKDTVDNGEVAVLFYEVSITTAQYKTLTANFTVTVQEPTNNTNDDYIQVNANSTWIDLTRVNDDGYMKKDEKTIKFDVFKMNSGVIVDAVEVTEYTGTAAAAGTYQYQILKNGQKVEKTNVDHETQESDTSWWITTGKENQVVVHPTSLKVDNGLNKALAVSGGAFVPNYDNGGAGVYTFALYKWENDASSNSVICVQQLAVDVTTVVNSAGAYTLNRDAQISNHVDVDSVGGLSGYNIDDAKAIVKCFTIKDTKGNDVVKTDDGVNYYIPTDKNYLFYVDYSAPTTANYVYVKEIVFYEDIGNGVYIPFVVNVDVSLENR